MRSDLHLWAEVAQFGAFMAWTGQVPASIGSAHSAIVCSGWVSRENRLDGRARRLSGGGADCSRLILGADIFLQLAGLTHKYRCFGAFAGLHIHGAEVMKRLAVVRREL